MKKTFMGVKLRTLRAERGLSQIALAHTLAAFAVQARDEVNLDQLTADLHAAVDEAMQPAHVGLWLRP